MLKVKIADTPYKLEQGLMFVEHMPEDEGMLFVFPRPMKLSFWGRNTFIPLDVAFVTRDNVIVKIAHIKPFDMSAVKSDTDCLFAIETNAGYFEDNKVEVGTKINLERYKDAYGQGLVRFSDNNKGNKAQDTKVKTQKQAQTIDPNTQNGIPPKVEKPGQDKVGEPIGQQPAEQDNPDNLPIITPGDIGKYMEDSFDEETEPTPGVEDFESQLGELPEEEPVEEQIPQEEAPEEVQPTEEKYPQFTTAYAAIDWATHNNEVVRIVYTSKRGRQITRDIEPHGQFHSESTYRQILVTFDETVGNIRAFIIRNISKWAFVGKQFAKKFVVRA